jgi:tetratricopeptide (TPR) repeat protein
VGYPDRALCLAREAVTWAKELAHPLSLNNAMLVLAAVHQSRREPEEAAWASGTVLKDTNRYGRGQEAYHGIIHGWATNNLDEARRYLSILRGSEEKLSMTFWIAIVAEVEASHGDHATALDLIEESERLAAQTCESYSLSELHWRKASFLMARGERKEATHWLEEAIEVARRQGARSAELRASVLLGQVLREYGRRDEARALLRPIHDCFTEGRELQAMAEARGLLQ